MFNTLVTKIKGEEFRFDPRIKTATLIKHFFLKTVGILRFVLRLKTLKIGFLGPNISLRNKHKISFGKNLSIDRNCFIDALSTDGIVCGDNVSINKNVDIECSGTMKDIGKGLILGNNVGIGSHCFFGCAGGIIIGADTIIGNYVSLHSENHNHSDITTPIRLQGVERKGIVIGENCWIGSKVTILDGATIGEGCIVAAGAVVTNKTYPKNSIIGGVPAKILKTRG
jgi:acetyltransferase-like isoleucine patch superfamily enzyme